MRDINHTDDRTLCGLVSYAIADSGKCLNVAEIERILVKGVNNNVLSGVLCVNGLKGCVRDVVAALAADKSLEFMPIRNSRYNSTYMAYCLTERSADRLDAAVKQPYAYDSFYGYAAYVIAQKNGLIDEIGWDERAEYLLEDKVLVMLLCEHLAVRLACAGDEAFFGVRSKYGKCGTYYKNLLDRAAQLREISASVPASGNGLHIPSLENFVSGTSRQTGIYIFSPPTGTGKSYEASRLIYDYVSTHRDSDVSQQILFVTPKIKDLDLATLKKRYDKNGDGGLFEREVIRMKSANDCIRDAFGRITTANGRYYKSEAIDSCVPEKYRSGENFGRKYSGVKDALYQLQMLEDARIQSSAEFLEEYRKQVRDAFHGWYKVCLKDIFKGPDEALSGAEKLALIRKDPGLGWLETVYPNIAVYGAKCVYLTAKMLTLNMNAYLEPAQSFAKYAAEEKIIFMDEYDACKDVILDTLLEAAVKHPKNILTIFNGIHDRLHTLSDGNGHISTSNPAVIDAVNYAALLKANGKDRGDGGVFEALLSDADEIYKAFRTASCYKFLGKDAERNMSVIFQSIEMLSSGGYGNYVTAEYDDGTARVGIRLVSKEEYEAKKKTSEGEELNLWTMLRRINAFLTRFGWFVTGWAKEYALEQDRQNDREYMAAVEAYAVLDPEEKRAAGKPVQRGLTKTEDAAKTILNGFLLSDTDMEYILSLPHAHKNGKDRLPYGEASLYQRPPKFFVFEDSQEHIDRTYILMCAMDDTPESFLVRIAQGSRIIGMSATAGIEGVIGNFDAGFLRDVLGQNMTGPTKEESDGIREMLAERNRPYAMGQIQTHVSQPDLAFRDLNDMEEIECAAMESLPEVAAEVIDYVNGNFAGSPRGENECAYISKRYLSLLLAIKEFSTHKAQSIVCFNQTLAGNDPKYHKDMLTKWIRRIDPALCVHCVNTESYEEKKERFLEDLKRGERVVVITSFATMGAGQNINHEYPAKNYSRLVHLESGDPGDDRVRKKDFDEIYIGDIRHCIPNIRGELQRTYNERCGTALKYVYYAGAAFDAGEITLSLQNGMIRDSVAFIDKPKAKANPFERDAAFRRTRSFRRAATRVMLQSLGRILRTFNKNPDIYIYLTGQVIDTADVECFNAETNILPPEAECVGRFIKERQVCPAADPDAASKDTRNAEIAGNMMKQFFAGHWTPEKVDRYKGWCRYASRGLFCDKEELSGSPDSRFYIDAHGQDRYWYAQRRDFRENRISFEGPSALAKYKDDGWVIGEVSSDALRLSSMLAFPGAKEYFEAHGFSTEWVPGELAATPVFFNNILKGRYSEAFMRHYFESAFPEVGILEIEDLERFEKADFELFSRHSGILLDVKHYRSPEGDYQKAEYLQPKICEKMASIGAKHLYVVNIIQPADYSCHSVADPVTGLRITYVPGVIYEDGSIVGEALSYLKKELSDDKEEG